MRAPSTSSRGAHKRWPRRNSTLSRLSMDWALLSLGSLVFVCCLTPFWGPTSPSSRSSTTLFFFKFELAFSPTSVGIWGGGGGRLIGTWVLGASFEVYPLFLLANWPFRPVLCFRSMPSSSSFELTVTYATIKFRVWAAKSLSDLALESESCTDFSGTPSSSSKWNLSISSERDKCKDAISTTVAAWGGICWSGITSGRGFD